MRTFLCAMALAALLHGSVFGLDSFPKPITPDFTPDRVFYIDPATGDDGRDGLSRETAWRTLGKANEALQAGDAVTLLEGEYVDQRIEPAHSGAPGKPIVYQGEKGKRVVVRAMARRNLWGPRDGLVRLAGRDHIVVQDLELDGNRAGLKPRELVSCISAMGDGNIFRRLTVHDANGAGIVLEGRGALTPGLDAPNVYEAEALPFCIDRVDGNWARPIRPERSGEAVIVSREKPWDGSDPLQRKLATFNERTARILTRDKGPRGTWRLPMPLRTDGAGDAWIAVLGKASAVKRTWLVVGEKRFDLDLPTDGLGWSKPVSVALTTGTTSAWLVTDAPGVEFDRVAVSRLRPELPLPAFPIAPFDYTTSDNIIEDCHVYYCCNLDAKNAKSPEDRQSAIMMTKIGSGNVVRMCHIHHNGADGVQPRRGGRGLVIEWNDIHGNNEDSLDLKGQFEAVVRYNLMHSNRGGGIVIHDGDHPDPPMYVAGIRVYGNVIGNIHRQSIHVYDAMRVYGDGRDTIAIHDNLVLPSEGAAGSSVVDYCRAPVVIERNTFVEDSVLWEFGDRHTILTSRGGVARRFLSEVALRGNVLHRAKGDAPLLTAVWRHPDDTFPNLGANLVSVPNAEVPLLEVRKGNYFGTAAPEGWLRFEAVPRNTRAMPAGRTLRRVGKRFMLLQAEPGDAMEMEFTIPKAVRAEVMVAMMRYGNRGVARLSLDGEAVEGEHDLWLPRPKSDTVTISLGVHDLAAGKHTVRAEAVRRHEGQPTAWMSISGIDVRPASSPVPKEIETLRWGVNEWGRVAKSWPEAKGSVTQRAAFRDAETGDYGLNDGELGERFGPRWSQHLSWFGPEQAKRMRDPLNGFENPEYKWERSQLGQ